MPHRVRDEKEGQQETQHRSVFGQGLAPFALQEFSTDIVNA
jgi:hypothetical protein